MKIISFTGPKGSGKDSAALILHKANVSQGKISFAGPMKEILSRLCSVPLATFEDPALKEKPFDRPVILDLALMQMIVLEMLRMLPPTEFDYNNGRNWLSTEQTRLMSPRHMLQYVGTEMIRNNVHPDWHVAAAFRSDVLDRLPQDGTFCVTDARFPNEYLWLKNRFGADFSGFYVNRPEAEENLARAMHDSELQVKEVRKLIPIANVLDNSGTLVGLKSEILKKLYKGVS